MLIVYIGYVGIGFGVSHSILSTTLQIVFADPPSLGWSFSEGTLFELLFSGTPTAPKKTEAMSGVSHGVRSGAWAFPEAVRRCRRRLSPSGSPLVPWWPRRRLPFRQLGKVAAK